MKQFFRNYFTFNKRERNGVFVLLLIIILLLVYLNVSHLFYKKQPVDFSAFEKEIKELNEVNPLQTNESYRTQEQLFEFNPNNLTAEKWKLLGLSEKQIAVIKNYESKGGKF